MNLLTSLRVRLVRALLPELRASPEDPRISLADPRIVDLIFGGAGKSATGVRVNEDKAMTVATVYACVRVLAETIAGLPLHVYQTIGGGRKLANQHPAYSLLHDEPNGLMTSFIWRELAMAHTLLWGNHYSQLIWNAGGRIMEFWPLLPWQVEPKWVDGGADKIYIVRDGAGKIELRNWEMLHIPGLSFDGLKGISPVRKMAEDMGLAIATRDFGSRFFANDARPGVVLETPGKLSDIASKNLTESIASQFAGLENKFKVMVLEQGAKLHTVQIPPEEAQFLETRNFQRREICGAYRVPPYMVGDLEKANYNNMEQQDLGFVKHTIVPWLVRWEQELNSKIFTRGTGYYAKFALQGLLRGDFKTRSEGLVNYVNNGIMLANEARELEELDPIAGLDRPRQPLNIGTLDSKGQLQGPSAAADLSQS